MCALNRSELPDEIDYPEADGVPMGETPLHRDEMFELIACLRRRFAADPSVYVSGNMMMYYEPGNRSAVFSPDVFVALGAGDGERRVYKIWDEACPPTVVIEVSSRSTAREDKVRKRELCERLGVQEYWLYDPANEGPGPPLQGWRLRGWRYAPIVPEADGSLASGALGLRLRVEADGLVNLYDVDGHCLPRLDDVYAGWAAGAALADRAEADRRAAEARAAAAEAAQATAEAEVVRLRSELARARGESVA
jgi:Uma2 family endonuclease